MFRTYLQMYLTVSKIKWKLNKSWSRIFLSGFLWNCIKSYFIKVYNSVYNVFQYQTPSCNFLLSNHHIQCGPKKGTLSKCSFVHSMDFLDKQPADWNIPFSCLVEIVHVVQQQNTNMDADGSFNFFERRVKKSGGRQIYLWRNLNESSLTMRMN